MRSFYGTIHAVIIDGTTYVSVVLLHDGEVTTRLNSEGSARSFEALDEGLSALDGAALAWQIGATPPTVAHGGVAPE